ncbi:lipopolysaccharide transport periplasmic protein LptA [Variibacter gotjawalensis]|uniref:Lipopolysaccharide transport periplasmic protein LptA n=1 Tax=Variibacter gotjawalensis TaxID=1333996 RepID=A0A0S3PV60_9BRAD|nr:LptA/OstA family protein [Variibacter gotjawalensis]NIK50105.1 lipopolysaccharide export system protein LptA [Variibacter gotjawalensis]RZS46104.1 lipopolysaccharide export system protein LptA [Variibacter gotjawalensis]BAT59779.1 lipopolysaccharide transport periplasmic protein LptA [Variibacter gotjawalensis]
MMSRGLWYTGLICAALAFAAPSAFAQPQNNSGNKGMPGGFSQNKGQPINITAQELEVRDKDKVATFKGKVRAVQGDSVLETAHLVVFYEGDAMGSGSAQRTPAPAAPSGGGNSQIKRLEAKGGVILTQKDQVATGNEAIYDMQANTVLLIGDATATQGDNVITGDRINVNMTTGVTKVIPKPGGTVSTIFKPNDAQNKPEVPKPAAPLPAPQRAPNAAPKQNGSSATGTSNRPAQTAPRRDASQPTPLRQ